MIDPLSDFVFCPRGTDIYAYVGQIKGHESAVKIRKITIIDPLKEYNILEAAIGVLNEWGPTVGKEKLKIEDFRETDTFRREFTESIKRYMSKYPAKSDENNLGARSCEIAEKLNDLERPYFDLLELIVQDKNKTAIKKMVDDVRSRIGYVIIPEIDPTLRKSIPLKAIIAYCYLNCIPFIEEKNTYLYECRCAHCTKKGRALFKGDGTEVWSYTECDSNCTEKILTKAIYSKYDDGVIKGLDPFTDLYNSGVTKKTLDFIVNSLDDTRKEFVKTYYLENKTFNKDFKTAILKVKVNNNIYKGISQEGNGTGEVIYANKDHYIGTLVNHKRSGQGELITSTIVYKGTFENDLLKSGTMTYNSTVYKSDNWNSDRSSNFVHAEYDNGDVYDGGIRYKNGKFIFDGAGTYTHHGESKYTITSNLWTGDFTARNAVIKGTESIYSGPIEHGKKNDFGRYEVFNSFIYEGNFVDDAECGGGIYYFADKEITSEKWSRHLTSDRVKIVYHDGRTYEGPMADGKRNGDDCKYIVPGEEGYTYIGSFSKDHPFGEGEYLYSTGVSLSSKKWINDLITDQVLAKYPDNTEYTGGYRQRRFGNGTMIISDGRVSITCDNWDDSYQGICTVIDKSDGTEYVGELPDGTMSGKGTLTKTGECGFTYSGEFSNNLLHGKGVLTQDGRSEKCVWNYGVFVQGFLKGPWKDGIYSGKWEKSFPNGEGRFVDSLGNIYEGGFLDGMFHGQGKYTSIAGDVRDGKWKYGTFMENRKYIDGDKVEDVPCQAILPSGEHFSGVWEDGHPVFGTKECSDGSVYIGHLDPKTGLFEGQGKITWSWSKTSEETWSGQWEAGKPYTGEGFIRTEDGLYFGKLDSEKKVGEGILYHVDGLIIEGVFQEDVLKEVTKLQYPDGSIYEGSCQGISREGEGTFYESDRMVRYRGNFKDDALHGFARMERKDDSGKWKTIYEGNWQNGIISGYGYKANSDGTHYVGYWRDGKYEGNGILYSPQPFKTKKGYWHKGERISKAYHDVKNSGKEKGTPDSFYNSHVPIPWTWNKYAAILPGGGQMQRDSKGIGLIFLAATLLCLILGVLNYNNGYVGFNYLVLGILIHFLGYLESYIYLLRIKAQSKKSAIVQKQHS